MFLPLSASAVTMVPLRTALLASHQLFLWSTPGAKVLSVKAGAGNCPAAHWTTRPSTAPASRTASGRRSITRGRPAPARSARRNAGLTGKECNFECVGVFIRTLTKPVFVTAANENRSGTKKCWNLPWGDPGTDRACSLFRSYRNVL